MSVGSSGRIVLEIEPDLKKELYKSLAMDSMNMKQWFLQQVSVYMESNNQLPLKLDNGVTNAKGDSNEI